jgi:hypothetical protein
VLPICILWPKLVSPTLGPTEKPGGGGGASSVLGASLSRPSWKELNAPPTHVLEEAGFCLSLFP